MPAGTVTVMFTDLVGSTELLLALGERRFGAVRADHDRTIHAEIKTHDGEIVKDTGDGFMAVFAGAAGAIAAAADIQQQIDGRNAESDIPLGVRIGISAGDVVRSAGDLHGLPAIEAARLCGAAAGGQILASGTVCALAGGRADHELVPLGELDLKGLPPLETVAVRWSPEAPVARPAGSASGNLPASVDRFIGRATELVAIPELLATERLVTLTGPGGSGKTRLAVEVGRIVRTEHSDAVWLVELAGVDDEMLVADAVAAALGLERPRTAAEALRAHLAHRATLLVLDNCEHLLDGIAQLVDDLLAACPNLHVLATSREPLRVAGEREYPVGPLSEGEAVELLLERIPGGHRAAREDGDALGRICTAVDGIPLAIELAAARLRVYSPEQLADRLDDQLSVLTDGGRIRPDRQRTLRATLDWSYDLLRDDEKATFRRLAIFVDGFTLEGAHEVLAHAEPGTEDLAKTLEGLAMRSFVTVGAGSITPRFRLLEPIRQYASERLDESGERGDLAALHLRWVTGLARRVARESLGLAHPGGGLRAEQANVQHALDHALANDEPLAAARIVYSLGPDMLTIDSCRRVLDALPDDVSRTTRAGVLIATARVHQDRVEYAESVPLLIEADEIYRGVGVGVGVAWTSLWLGRAAWAVDVLGVPARTWFEDARALFDEAGLQVGRGWCAAFIAGEAWAAGDLVDARSRATEAIEIGRSARADQVLAEGLRVVSVVAAAQGDFVAADAFAGELLVQHSRSGDLWQLASAEASTAWIAAARGDPASAAAHALAASDLALELDSRERAVDAVGAAALALHAADRPQEAARLLGALSNVDARSLMIKQFQDVRIACVERGVEAELEEGRQLSVEVALDRARPVLRSLVGARVPSEDRAAKNART